MTPAQPAPPRPAPQRGSTRRLLLDMLPLLLLILLVLATTWLVRSMPAEVLSQPAAAASTPSAYMRDFQTLHFGSDGRLLTAVSGQAASHFPLDDSIHIQHMQGYHTQPDHTLLHARADRAIMVRSTQQTDLYGQVRLERTASPAASAPPLLLQGTHLHISQQPQRITTAQPIHITQGSHHISGQGLDYQQDSQTLTMQGRVRARIAPQQH